MEGPLGSPPFEKPSIAKGVTNFVLHRFSGLPAKDWQTMYDLAKMFLHCLNHWKLETPAARKQVCHFTLLPSLKFIFLNMIYISRS